ncbi:MAG: hypothetical protein AAE983_00715 [Thermoplasmataceae archaeon]|jgi:hypothetical protein
MKPSRKFDRESFRLKAKKHKQSIVSLKAAKAPELGETKKYSLEDEF